MLLQPPVVDIPKLPISSDLLEVVPAPAAIPPDSSLQDALRITAENHALYGQCYLKQSALIDAVKARGY